VIAQAEQACRYAGDGTLSGPVGRRDVRFNAPREIEADIRRGFYAHRDGECRHCRFGAYDIATAL